jgi:hypothetical protein
MNMRKGLIQSPIMVLLVFLSMAVRAIEPIQDIKAGDVVQIACEKPLTVLGKANVMAVTSSSITVKSKGENYTFALTNITINGKTYAESSLLTASAHAGTAFAKLLDLIENPMLTPPPDLRYSKPVPNYTYYPHSGGMQILPYRNPDSRDPTLNEVIRFVKSTHISERLYVLDNYVCGNFAHDLIKGAESAGLHCTLASMQFRGEKIGHAIVAFRTADYGLMFIDCTGGMVARKPGTFNTIGYLKIGKSYGRLPLDVGKTDPNHYEFYELAKAAMDGARNESAAPQSLDAQKRALAGELDNLKKFALNHSATNDPALTEKLAHYQQQEKSLATATTAQELREQLREDPYMDYEKVVTSITIW